MVVLTMKQAIEFVRQNNPNLNDDEIQAEALRIVKESNQSMDDVMLKE